MLDLDDLSYADAIRSRIDRLYEVADAPGTPRELAEELAAKAHLLLERLKGPFAD